MKGHSEFLHFTADDFAATESFQAYVLKENEADILFWEAFTNLHPEKHAELQAAVDLVSALKFRKAVSTEQVKQHELERLFSSLSLPAGSDKAVTPISELPTLSSQASGRQSFFPNTISLIAACTVGILFVVCMAAFFARDFFGETSFNYKTAFGENTLLVLPDSSTVILNGNTSLHYEGNWSDNAIREVWLDGEAFFEVTHKGKSENSRFIVHTPGMDVEVLGTKFNVFNRKDKANVVLNSGKVKVKFVAPYDTSLFMMPDEEVEFSRKDHTIVRKQVKAEILTSWRNKVLVFENTPLYEIGEMIENTYGIRVVFTPEVDANEKLAGTIPSENLEMLLTILAKSSNLHITRDNDQIIIAKKETANSKN